MIADVLCFDFDNDDARIDLANPELESWNILANTKLIMDNLSNRSTTEPHDSKSYVTNRHLPCDANFTNIIPKLTLIYNIS